MKHIQNISTTLVLEISFVLLSFKYSLQQNTAVYISCTCTCMFANFDESVICIQLRVRATDGGGLTADATVFISINRNIFSPEWLQTSYVQSIAENFALGQTIVNLQARDQDALVCTKHCQLKRPSHNATNRAIIYLPNFFNFCKQNFLKCTFNIYSNIHVHMYMYNVKSFLSSHLTICCPTPLLETVRLYSISKFPVQEQFLFVSLLPRQASPNSQ